MFELIMAKLFPKLIANNKPQIQESWKTQSKIKKQTHRNLTH